MPIAVLTTRTTPNSASWNGPTVTMRTSRAPRMALNRVKTLALTISPTVRLGRSGTALTRPAATRFATAASSRPASARVGTGEGYEPGCRLTLSAVRVRTALLAVTTVVAGAAMVPASPVAAGPPSLEIARPAPTVLRASTAFAGTRLLE